MIIIAGLLGAAIASRQVLLHIMPGDAGYGSALIGYHFYTWAFLCFVAAIAASAAMLLFPGQFAEVIQRPGLLELAAVWLIFAVTLANGASALLECGFTWCPDTPVHYELLYRPG
jgi:hypothetical protein